MFVVRQPSAVRLGQPEHSDRVLEAGLQRVEGRLGLALELPGEFVEPLPGPFRVVGLEDLV